MAFTAGSAELAKANKLGNILAHLFSVHGLSGAAGRTGALLIEKAAKKLGFGITGITTGAVFPPFGSILPSLASGTEAALQNPRGVTRPNNIGISGVIEGQTVGIYMKKFVRTGADYKAVLYGGTLGATLSPGMVGISAFAPVGGMTLDPGDRINFGTVFGNDDFAVMSNVSANALGYTLFAGLTKNIPFVSAYAGATKSPGTAFTVETIGINSFTGLYTNQPAVAGTTFEGFVRNTIVNAGFTAAIYYTSPSGGSGTWVVS
jgi:hypothetical protein